MSSAKQKVNIWFKQLSILSLLHGYTHSGKLWGINMSVNMTVCMGEYRETVKDSLENDTPQNVCMFGSTWMSTVKGSLKIHIKDDASYSDYL